MIEKVLKGFEFRIKNLTKDQEIYLNKNFGCNRFVYNWGLTEKIIHYEKYRNKKVDSSKKRSRDLMTWIDLGKKLTKHKKEYTWIKEVDSQALQQTLRHLDTAYYNFFQHNADFPRFKSKKDRKQTFQIPQRTQLVDNKLHIPKLEKPLQLVMHRPFEGILKTVTLKKTASGKYFAVLLSEVAIDIPNLPKVKEETTIGIDLGLTHFAILSTGEKVENPRWLKKTEGNIVRQNRWLSRKKKGSKNRDKQRIKLAKAHEKVALQRKDFLHKLSSRIIRENQTICIEDLAVSNMLKNHKLAKSIQNVGWGYFRRFLTYKAGWYGRNLITIGRFQPSSKLCDNCGTINQKLTLRDRNWTCECGTKHDRDILAAKNIKTFGIIKHNRVSETRINACGEAMLQSPSMKQEIYSYI